MAVVSFIATGTFVSGMACIAVGLFLTLRQAGDHPSTTAASEGALLPRIIEAMSRFADSLSKYPAGMQLVFIGALLAVVGGALGITGLTIDALRG